MKIYTNQIPNLNQINFEFKTKSKKKNSFKITVNKDVLLSIISSILAIIYEKLFANQISTFFPSVIKT
jgi:hypothetical protein